MFKIDPKERISVSEIMKHPWYKGEVPSKEKIISEFEERKRVNDEVAEEQREKTKHEKKGAKKHKASGYRGAKKDGDEGEEEKVEEKDMKVFTREGMVPTSFFTY